MVTEVQHTHTDTTHPDPAAPSGPDLPTYDDVGDYAWAAPSAKASPRMKVAAVALATILVLGVGFIAGAKIGKDRAGSRAGGPAGALANFRNGGGFAGFGGAGPTGGTGNAAAAAAPGALGGLLPGLDAGATPTTVAGDGGSGLGALLPGLDTGTPADSTPAGASGGAGLSGTVTGVKGSTITITDATGKHVTITAGDATAVARSQPASLADVKAGTYVSVTGSTGADGTVSAEQITIGPKPVVSTVPSTTPAASS